MIADLRELERRTADERGAQRLCWSRVLARGASALAELLAEIGAEPEVDEAGNLWARLEGADPGAPALVVGSHLDSVPDGGWLDGALGVMAGARRPARLGRGRPATRRAAGARRLGRRGGGALRPQPVRQLGVRRHARSGGAEAAARRRRRADRRGARRERGRARARRRLRGRREGLGAYLELHIEQGPRMEAAGAARRRGHRLRRGRAAALRLPRPGVHAGTTPMEARRDAGLAAARRRWRSSAFPRARAGSRPPGELRLEPGIATAVAGAGDPLRRPAQPRRRALGADARAASACAGPPPTPALRARRDADLEDRADPVRPGLVFAARARLRRRSPGSREHGQRRPSRRRRGRAGAAGGDDVRPLAWPGSATPSRRTPRRPTWRSRSRRSADWRLGPWPAASANRLAAALRLLTHSTQDQHIRPPPRI